MQAVRRYWRLSEPAMRDEGGCGVVFPRLVGSVNRRPETLAFITAA